MKSYLLYFAMFLLILCLPFRGNEHEVRWIWANYTWVPLILIGASLMCIAGYLLKNKSEKAQ